jgi:hypothetical protein
MVEVRKENGDVFTLKKDVYDLATGLLGIFKETDPIIFEVPIENAKTTSLLRSGEIVVISAFVPIGKSGSTNLIKNSKHIIILK